MAEYGIAKLVAPSHIAATVPKVMVGVGFMTMVIGLEMTVVGSAHAAFEVMTTVIKSPSCKGVMGVKIAGFGLGNLMAFAPFLFH